MRNLHAFKPKNTGQQLLKSAIKKQPFQDQPLQKQSFQDHPTLKSSKQPFQDNSEENKSFQDYSMQDSSQKQSFQDYFTTTDVCDIVAMKKAFLNHLTM